MSILLTGGTGFIGSHTAIEMINAGYDIIIADNLSNSSEKVIDRIKIITGVEPKFYKVDVSVKENVRKIFNENKIDGVMHFAGYKCVPESIKMPFKYYRNNLETTLTILEVMEENNCNAFVFSSSATVYGDKNQPPFTENMETSTTNPYGSTKLMIENILKDMANANKSFSVIILRYFNPIGAHPSGLIGEFSKGTPNNLMPYILQTASKEREYLSIYGSDYNTLDGTAVRDYIHVVDLAKGHVAAIKYALEHKGVEIINLGTQTGNSVLEVTCAFEKANIVNIPIVFEPRRPGDVECSYADITKAIKLLDWSPKKDLKDMCKDSWNAYKKEKINSNIKG